MTPTQEQLEKHQDGFQQVVNSGAFQLMESYFEGLSLHGNLHGSDINDLGQAYIRESGIRAVFRAFREFAEGRSQALEPDPFEDEALEDDATDMLD